MFWLSYLHKFWHFQLPSSTKTPLSSAMTMLFNDFTWTVQSCVLCVWKGQAFLICAFISLSLVAAGPAVWALSCASRSCAVTVVWVNKAWAEPAAQSDVLGTDLDIDVRPLPFPSSGRALKLLFLLLVLPFVPITWGTIQPEKDKFHNLSCQAVRWSLPFRRGARCERAWAAEHGHPSCPAGLWVLPSHTAA